MQVLTALPSMSDEEIIDLLSVERVGRIGLNDTPQPYVVPTDFVFGNGFIYVHTPHSGKKAELARKDPYVCFEVDRYNREVTEYRSVIIRGMMTEVRESDEIHAAMCMLAEKATRTGFVKKEHGAGGMAEVSVFRIEIKEMTGIKSPVNGHP
jgi:uncharacterized protein